MPKIIKAPALRAGGTIGVIAPGSPAASGETLEQAGKFFSENGFKCKWGETARPMEGYLAGTDFERRADLERMWLDKSIDAIWCLRGGYGSIRLLPHLYFRLFADRPTIFIGFSDITALELGLWSQVKLVTFHGPTLSTLTGSGFSINQALAMLTKKTNGILEWPKTNDLWYTPIKPGKAHGRILGGNLATICSLIGTRFFPDLDGVILFLEETGEAGYRIDRMLTQLILTGALDNLTAVIVGRCVPVAGQNEADLIKVFTERLAGLNCPSGYGFPIGHISGQWTLPQGVTADVDTAEGRLELAEEAVARA